MVTQLLRLKLRLLGNSLKRSTWQVVGLLIGLGYGVGAATVAVSSLVALRLASVEIAGSFVVVFGAIIILGFIVLPLAFGVDDAMDPRKFSGFAIDNARLAQGLVLAALVSVPSLAITVVAVAQVVTWTRGPLPVLFALLGVVVIVATCVLLARVTSAVGAVALSSRRIREIASMVGVVVLMLGTSGFLLLLGVDWRKDGIPVLSSIAYVVGWTPLGAVWAAPADAAAGDVGRALLKELIAVLFVAALWLAWKALVARILVTHQHLPHAHVYRGLGWFAVLPGSAAWTIAARSLTYWSRDARYNVSLLIIPIVPFMMIIPLAVAGVPANYLALLPMPVVAVFLSWAIHNDVSYDNTAIWLHVAAAVRGRADRVGRAIPPLLVGVPVVFFGSIICADLFGDLAVLPSLLGVSLCILFSGLGLSSIMSASFPYPTVRPGDSPFMQPQAGGTASSVIQALSFAATFALAIPALVFAALGILDDPGWAWASLAVGLVFGAAVLFVGVVWGGRIFERRGPELLAFSVRN